MADESVITAQQIEKDYYDMKLKRCHASRSSATRASELGHPCNAYLAWTRIAGEKADLPDRVLACIFAEGNLQEQGVKRDLMDAGYEIIEAQRTLAWDKFHIVGHIDGKITRNGSRPVVFDVKSISPYGFAKINTVDDMLNHRSFYYQKWPAQLQIYMLMEGEDRAMMILKSKTTGEIKAIPFTLDYDYAESLLKKAEAVQQGVEMYSSKPDSWEDDWLQQNRADDIDICQGCHFKTICRPNIDAGAGAVTFDDPEMEQKIERHEEIKPIAKEYDELHEEITDEAKVAFEQGHPALLVGHWVISGKFSKRTVYNVPKEVKQQYTDMVGYWRTTIAKVE